MIDAFYSAFRAASAALFHSSISGGREPIKAVS